MCSLDLNNIWYTGSGPQKNGTLSPMQTTKNVTDEPEYLTIFYCINCQNKMIFDECLPSFVT